MTNFERRTENRPSITFPEGAPLDSHPFITPRGRLVPSEAFSRTEFTRLLAISEGRERREGQLDLIIPVIVPTPRQLARISIRAVTGCWELPVYEDKKNRARYGNLQVGELGATRTLAHRTMYKILHGPDSVSDDQFLDHLCEHKPCCYPRHLEPVSSAENTRRGRERLSQDQLVFDLEDLKKNGL